MWVMRLLPNALHSPLSPSPSIPLSPSPSLTLPHPPSPSLTLPHPPSPFRTPPHPPSLLLSHLPPPPGTFPSATPAHVPLTTPTHLLTGAQQRYPPTSRSPPATPGCPPRLLLSPSGRQLGATVTLVVGGVGCQCLCRLLLRQVGAQNGHQSSVMIISHDHQS